MLHRSQDSLQQATDKMLRSLDTRAMQKVLAAFRSLGSSTITVGSFCSGCEMISFSLAAVREVLEAKYKINIAFDHTFAADKDLGCPVLADTRLLQVLVFEASKYSL
jgi:hypothetical protein